MGQQKHGQRFAQARQTQELALSGGSVSTQETSPNMHPLRIVLGKQVVQRKVSRVHSRQLLNLKEVQRLLQLAPAEDPAHGMHGPSAHSA